MARARNIKPGFFANELLGAADPLLMILFAALWCLADREGRLEDRPLRIRAFAFPYRDGINCAALLADLASLGFISRYVVAGQSLIQIAKFADHQSPHHTERPSMLPPQEHDRAETEQSESLTVNAPKRNRKATDRKRSDSLIPDSPIPDSLIPEDQPLAGGTPSGQADAKPAPQKAGLPSKTDAIWTAYSGAYRARYRVDPVRNASVNSKLAGVVNRLGAEAPNVAAFYVRHNGLSYVRAHHDVGLLLRDCEGLRTQWATNRTLTDAGARQVDRTATNAAAFADLIAEQHDRETSTTP